MSSDENLEIFYFDDDPEEMVDHVKILRKNYNVDIGAHRDLVEKQRNKSVDLVIVDLMIHLESFDLETGREVENINYPHVSWTRTGLEFLRRLRDGEYEWYGFPDDVPVIVASAVIDYPAEELTKKMGISCFLEKPFRISELEAAITKTIATR